MCNQNWESKLKRLLCASVGLPNHRQNNNAAATTDKSDSIARDPKCETSFATIATPNITDSARLAIETSVVPMRLALDSGIPVWRICAPTTSYDMCPNLDNTCIRSVFTFLIFSIMIQIEVDKGVLNREYTSERYVHKTEYRNPGSMQVQH